MKRTEITAIAVPVVEDWRHGEREMIAHLPVDAKHTVAEALGQHLRNVTDYRVEVETSGNLIVRTAVASKTRVYARLTTYDRQPAYRIGTGYFARRLGRRARTYVVQQQITKTTTNWIYHFSFNVAGFVKALKEELQRVADADQHERERLTRERTAEAIALRFKAQVEQLVFHPDVKAVALRFNAHVEPQTFGVSVNFKTDDIPAAAAILYLQRFREGTLDVSYAELIIDGLTEQQMEEALFGGVVPA